MHFSDHYLNVPFDLSKVMFVTTANRIDTIPSALRDRMEVISIAGYTDKEKLQIAKRYLIPKQLKENGLNTKRLQIVDHAMEKIIQEYTREAGLRNLEEKLPRMPRKVARKVAEGDRTKVIITTKNLPVFLGPSKYLPESQVEKDLIGVVSGLAWTEFGGDILYIEALCRKGKKELMLPAVWASVMKESVQAALSYIKSKAEELGIDKISSMTLKCMSTYHRARSRRTVPRQASPWQSAMISAITKKTVNRKIAMTGEITLTGRVLPIGGLKEKTLAAQRNRIETVIIPAENVHEMVEIPPYVKKQIKFLPVKTMDDVVKIVFGM